MTLLPGYDRPIGEGQSMLDHSRLRHLSPHEQDVLAEFLSRLREQFGKHIARAWLFGSKARSDSDAESDVDLLIVARDGDDALQKAIGEIAYDFGLEHSVGAGDSSPEGSRGTRRQDTRGDGASRAHGHPPGAFFCASTAC